MCVICVLEPGYTLPYEMLSIACHNNPHGYGVIIKREEGLDIRKGLSEDGNDPDEIYKILKENEDTQRVLHVRWKTQGDVSEDNTQPFEVFDKEIKIGKKKVRRHIAFAHNGTLGQYIPPYQHQAQRQGPVPRDTLNFANQVLRPFLPILHGDEGQADISDPFVKLMLDKYWSAGNRGILVCNNLENYLFNKSTWEEIETEEVIEDKVVQGKFLASNNDYFEKVIRGPLYEKQKREEEERKAAEKAANSAFSTQRENFLGYSPKFYEQYTLSESISDILEDYDMYRAEGYIQLANLTYHEWFKMVSEAKPDDVASMFLYLTDYLHQAHKEIDNLKNPPEQVTAA
jgi:predicted glutamine amidotransferase